MIDMKTKLSKEQRDFHGIIIAAFLSRFTNHKGQPYVINRGRKCDYSVTIDNKHRVSFWFDDEGRDVSYGAVGFGICACMPYDYVLDHRNKSN